MPVKEDHSCLWTNSCVGNSSSWGITYLVAKSTKVSWESLYNRLFLCKVLERVDLDKLLETKHDLKKSCCFVVFFKEMQKAA